MCVPVEEVKKFFEVTRKLGPRKLSLHRSEHLAALPRSFYLNATLSGMNALVTLFLILDNIPLLSC
jgi:hypothetical protein